MQQNLYSNCTHLSMDDVHYLVLTRGITGLICFGLCVVSLILEIVNLCLIKGSSLLQRFFIYVIIANSLRAALLSADIFSHRDLIDVDNKLCEAIGFISQYFASFQLLTVLAMMLLLFHNLFTLNANYKYFCNRRSFNKKYTDVVLIVILFLIPSLYTWVPFIIDGGIYGDTGPWCWLREYDSSCNEIKASFVFETVFWNAPFGAVLVFCFICVTIYLTFFLYTGCCRKLAYKMLTSVLVEACVLFIFFGFYTSLCVIELAALVYVHVRRKSGSYPWMVLYAVTLPIGEISLSLTSFAYLFRIVFRFCKQIRGKLHKQQIDEKERSMPKVSEYGHMYPSTRVSVRSFTSQQDRPAFVSPSSEWTSILPNEVNGYGSVD